MSESSCLRIDKFFTNKETYSATAMLRRVIKNVGFTQPWNGFSARHASYIHTPRTTPWTWCTFSDKIRGYVEQKPDAVAYVFCDIGVPRDQRTWTQLDEQSGKLASAFIRDGFHIGERALLLAPSSLHYIDVDTAACRAGLACIRHPQALIDLKTAGSIINNHRCAAFFFDPGEDGEFLDEGRKQMPELFDNMSKNGTVVSTAYPSLKKVYFMRNSSFSDVSTEDLIDSADAQWRDVTAKRESRLEPDDICVVHQTSGTTGVPKVIPYTHFDMINNMSLLVDFMECTHSDVYFNDRPFSWIGNF